MSTTTPESTPLVSNRLVLAVVWAAATLSYVGLLAVGREVAAVGAFALVAAVAVGYRRLAGVRFDERDADVVTTASGYAVQVFGVTSGVVFPALVLANGLGYYSWTAFTAGIATTVAAFFLVWGVALAVVRARR
ncbi:hypothetical protein [Halobaculum litoreum]|uniref:DUF2178 domain-containing protein n=1 Tax=Halobaculum litoreum TaxID=3031998 RepID=A0ABD5XQT9_9EURY|nr:hypothetical protein [Halobaculum sp. DT92]